MYRGVHGGYWAMVNRDAGNFGVTIHRVDKGVDTGYVLAQDVVSPAKGDGFFTYPLLQLQAGIPLLIEQIHRLSGRGWGVDDDRSTRDPCSAKSRQWGHPTIIQYIVNGIRTHVW